MESGDRTRVMTANARYSLAFDPRFSVAIPSYSGVTIPPSPVGIDPRSSLGFDHLGRNRSDRSGLITTSRGGVLMNLEMMRKMKIIQFSEKLDKFTMYFDKFLKTNGEGRN